MPGDKFTSDPYDILLGHNHWATRVLLERARELSPDDFHRVFPIGPGTLHDTLTHIIGAILRWADRIDGRPVKPSIERADGSRVGPMVRRTPDELLALLDQACADFAQVVDRAKATGVLPEVRDWTLGGDTYRFNVAAAIIHVTNHGMHHRAQCMNMLRHLGKPVNADLSEIDWQEAGEP